MNEKKENKERKAIDSGNTYLFFHAVALLAVIPYVGSGGVGSGGVRSDGGARNKSLCATICRSSTERHRVGHIHAR